MKKGKTLMEVFAEEEGIQSEGRQKGKFNVAGQVITHPKLKGEWIIVATQMAGGETGGGMNGHDDWPDGHELVLRRVLWTSAGAGRIECVVDWKVPEKRFYQSGCFTDDVMLTNPAVVRDLRK
jgi:hypothetical protein